MNHAQCTAFPSPRKSGLPDLRFTMRTSGKPEVRWGGWRATAVASRVGWMHEDPTLLLAASLPTRGRDKA
jgi:hypothetical protein